MKSRKATLLLAVIMMIAAMISCNMDDSVNKDDLGGSKARVTFSAAPRTSSRAVEPSFQFEKDDLRTDIDFSKEHINVTPSYFYADLSRVVVYEPADNEVPEKGSRQNYDILHRVGDTANNVNMLCSKGMEALTIPENSPFWNDEFHGFGVHMLPGIYWSNPVKDYDAYLAATIVGVKLPESLSGAVIKNAKTADELWEQYHLQLDPDVVWFDYMDLVPTVGRHMSNIIFQTGIEKPYLINAKGEDGERYAGALGGTGNFGIIVLPMKEPIDLRPYDNPVVKVQYDTSEMISFYKTGEKEYTPCLNISNPFPFEIDCDEYDPNEEIDLDSSISAATIKEAHPVSPIMVRRSPDEMHLQFIKPNYKDIDHIEIRYSSDDVEANSVAIYEGNENVFLHETDISKPYHYWAYTVDSQGRKSDGVPFIPSKIIDFFPGPDDGGNGGNGNEGGNGSIPNGKMFMTSMHSNATQLTDAGTIIKGYLEKNENIDFTTPVLKFTPAHFYTQIEEIRFYEPKDGKDPMKGALRQDTFFVKDEYKGHMNIDLLDPSTSIEFNLDPAGEGLRNHGWTGTGMKINGTYRVEMNDPDLKGTPGGTLIGIPKTSVSADVVFDNAVAQRWLEPAKGPFLGETKNDFIWFSLDQLVYPTGVFLDRFLWHGGVESGTYHNPEKITGEYTVGCFTDKTDRSTALVKPKERLKLEDPANDTLVLAVNPTELIWAYKTKEGKYHAVLNLDNPFPIQLKIMRSK